MKKNIVFLILFCIPIFSFSQNRRIKFDHISLQEGLSQSSVTSITQDSKGFIWFATIDGLNRYNGYEIKIYYNSDKKGSLADNVINDLFSMDNDKNGDLWVATAANGLCKYNKIEDNFINYKNEKNNKNSLSNNVVNALWGENGILWVGTQNGLNRFDTKDNSWKTFYHDKNNENSLPSNEIFEIKPDNDGNIWVVTSKGIALVNSQSFKITRLKNKFITKQNINTILVDSDNNLWIATDGGLFIYSVDKKNIETYLTNSELQDVNAILEDVDGIYWLATTANGLIRIVKKSFDSYSYKHDPADLHSLSTNNILSLFQDKSNILWIGTSLGGVNKWNRAADDLAVFRHNPYDSYSLSSNQVRSIFQDSKKTIWVGTVDGGLNEWIQEENKFIHFKKDSTKTNTISHNHVRTILEAEDGNLWLGTDGGGINYFDVSTEKFTHYKHDPKNQNSLSHNRVWKIYRDSKKQLWVATYGGGLNRFDTDNMIFKAYRNEPDNKQSISNDDVTCIYEDSKNRYWVGTHKGFNQFFPETGKFKQYVKINGDENTISNNRIYSIIEDSNGDIWIGTKGGLNKFNPDTETFEHYTVSTHDFPNNVMMGIIEDKNGLLWITTNRGLSKFNPESGKIRNFDMRDGLQSNEFLAGSYFKTTDGEIIVGGINGFNAFYPEKIKDNPNRPSLVITGFMVSNNQIKLDSAISEKHVIHLDHIQTDLSFQFVALDYIFPQKNQYAYQLIGYDDSMQYVKYQRMAKYTNLPPKTYIFKVIGSNNDEVWNDEGTEIKIVIHPAFYQTLWFKITAVLSIILLALFVVWLRIRMLQRQKRILEEQVRIRTKQVVEQKEEIVAKNKDLRQKQEEIMAQNEVLQQQKEEIETQRDEIESQHQIVLQQKKEITDSIIYAKRIQTAALPENQFLNQILPEHFIFFKPRDIVSGDFYWAGKKKDQVVITAADCTGHGVPGAFMSMLGISFLNEIVNELDIISPEKILDSLRENVISSLHQTGALYEAKDGMDITLCAIDYKTNTIHMAAANNPLYLVRDNEIKIYEADSMPIAIYEQMPPFKLTEIKFEKGDVIYMFSDGYPDQFGGPKGKKFMYKKFRNMLLDIHQKPMNEQKQYLEDKINKWMSYPNPYGGNSFEQIDDIVVIGVKL